MQVITLDFESYWAQDFTLSKSTTEAYIRDPRFEVIGVSVKVNDEPAEWASGTKAELKAYLDTFDWKNSAVIAHNAAFDLAILAWHFDIFPKAIIDTLSMSRALHGVESDHRLSSLAKQYEIGEKGNEVFEAKGKHRGDFSIDELSQYGDYCINDVELTYKLFNIFTATFPKKEYKLIDLTIRMFTEPTLVLNKPKLEQHLVATRLEKAKLLETLSEDTDLQRFLADPNAAPMPPPEVGMPNIENTIALKAALMSNPKLAAVLQSLDVDPPMKISKTTNKETYAFAKSDEAFQALLEHEDPRVQAVVTARLGVKSTLEETRTERLIGIAGRGLMPVPLRYYGAHTGRWSGDEKINVQNFKSRGQKINPIKQSIQAPKGYVVLDADSAQIEARVTAWLANQNDLVEDFRLWDEGTGDDVYKKQSSKIYQKPVSEITDEERFNGKTAVLSAQYGVGAVRFREQMRIFKQPITEQESIHIVAAYRESNYKIVNLWKECQAALMCMNREEPARIGRIGVLEVMHLSNAIRLPSGLCIRYDGLTAQQEEKGVQFYYKTRRSSLKIYGGKVCENVSQGIARCIIAEQMLLVAKRYRVVMTVHDSIVCCVRQEEAEEAAVYIKECMQWVPSWAYGLPVNCDIKIGPNYGETKKWQSQK